MRKLLGSLSLFGLAFGAAVGRADTPGSTFEAVHGVSASAYQTFVSRVQENMRIAYIHASGGSTPAFSAIAVNDGGGWSARHGMSAADYQAEFDKQAKAGRRPTSISGYMQGGQLRYAATWMNDAPGWVARHGISAGDYHREFDVAGKKGLRPAFVTGYQAGNATQFAAVFIPSGGKAVSASHNITAGDYQKLFDTLPKMGFRPDYVCAYNTGSGVRFNAVFVKDGNNWSAKHGMTAAAYQAEFDKQTKAGMRPSCISSYQEGGGLRFAAAWVKTVGPRAKLPVTGASVPTLASLDSTMLKAMNDRGFTGGVLAVSRGGRTVFAHGYGFRDKPMTQPVQPETPFRIASISKPLTAMVVRQMIAEGKIKGSDKALTLLGLKPTSSGDKRLADITIDHLLAHQGGWDRPTAGADGKYYDPMFDTLNIASKLKVTAPASAKDVVDYMLGQKLQFAPGSKTSYSNFGYCMLGRVVGAKSNRGYVAELQRRVVPIGMPSLRQARSLPGNRRPDEPIYLDSALATNVFNPSGSQVPFPDGGFHIEAMDAHGGLICSAPDLCKFMRAFWISGQPRAGGSQTWAHTGALPGMFGVAKQRADGVDFVALFNQRQGNSNDDAIVAAIDMAIDAVKTWP